MTRWQAPILFGLLVGSVLSMAAEKDPVAQPSVKDLAEQRAQRDRTVWQAEKLSHKYDAVFVKLWDDLLAKDKFGGDKFDVLAAVPTDSIRIGRPGEPVALGLEIDKRQTTGPGQTLTHPAWVARLNQWRDNGYRLKQSEWHHAAFTPAKDGRPAKSSVTFVLHAVHEPSTMRIAIEGVLKIEWAEAKTENAMPTPSVIDATDLRILTRKGPPAFERVLTVNPSSGTHKSGVHPIVLHDVNGDGLSDILLGGCNRLYLNKGGTRFEREVLHALPYRTFETAAVADLTGDGVADYLAPGLRGSLLVYRGDKNGRFTTDPIGDPLSGDLKQPQALTLGDIDGDGDLDVFVGQYRISYLGGNMPNPYYDANDGFPAQFYLNDGRGNLTPAPESMLGDILKKRHRRTYTAALTDLDGDNDLDLLVVSDFAGIDVYHNDGKGRFTDVTDRVIDKRHLFGMSATFGDYDGDGRLDFYVAGMSSTTARRLERLGLGRDDQPDIHKMRMAMAYGNRMYLSQSDGTFQAPLFADRVARTGWTWGTTTLDVENDGDRDIFVANGHSSGASTKDHCTHFWCHDIYDASSKTNPAMHDLFMQVHRGYLNRTESWDGYQKNALLMNANGRGFTNVAWLLGVADQFDGRAALSDDIDGDGRVDLLVVEDRWYDGQILHVYWNTIKTNNHWVGVRLRHQPGKPSPVGAKIVVRAAGRTHVGRVVIGETIHGQHAPTVHFGLGKATRIEHIEVTWPNGVKRRLESPSADRYHVVDAP